MGAVLFVKNGTRQIIIVLSQRGRKAARQRSVSHVLGATLPACNSRTHGGEGSFGRRNLGARAALDIPRMPPKTVMGLSVPRCQPWPRRNAARLSSFGCAAYSREETAGENSPSELQEWDLFEIKFFFFFN